MGGSQQSAMWPTRVTYPFPHCQNSFSRHSLDCPLGLMSSPSWAVGIIRWTDPRYCLCPCRWNGALIKSEVVSHWLDRRGREVLHQLNLNWVLATPLSCPMWKLSKRSGNIGFTKNVSTRHQTLFSNLYSFQSPQLSKFLPVCFLSQILLHVMAFPWSLSRSKRLLHVISRLSDQPLALGNQVKWPRLYEDWHCPLQPPTVCRLTHLSHCQVRVCWTFRLFFQQSLHSFTVLFFN